MPHVFRAASFINPPSAKDNTETDGRGNDSASKDVEDYLTHNDSASSTQDIDEVISVTSCTLSSGNIFTLVVIEDQIAGG